MSRPGRAIAFAAAVLAGLAVAGLAFVAGIIILGRQWARTDEFPRFAVQAVWAGATASEVEQTIAAPIEQQLSGVEHLRRLRSRSRDDGSYFLEVAVEPGVDLNIAQVLVQNRVALAVPILPVQVQDLGVTIRKASPGLLMIICLRSPDARFDDAELGMYANIKVRDELARLPGVSDVVIVGKQDFAMHIWLDPEKLAFRELGPVDVSRALDRQIPKASSAEQAGSDGKTQLSPEAPDSLTSPEQLEAMVIKADAEGSFVRLRDVARKLEFGPGRAGFASLDGKPVAALAVYLLGGARPEDVSATVEARLAELRRRSPKSLDAVLGFDASQRPTDTTSGYLLIDVDLPESTSIERTAEILGRCERFLQKHLDVRSVLALSEQPFDRDRGQPCLVVCLKPRNAAAVDRERLTRDLRAGLDTAAEHAAAFVVRDLSAPDQFQRLGYPIEFAVCGPDRLRVQELANQLLERMSQDRGLTGLRRGSRSSLRVSVEIDRAKVAALGLAYTDVTAAVGRVSGFAQAAGTIHLHERTWPLLVEIEPISRTNEDTLNQLRVRNSKGKMVPLRAVTTIRSNAEPKSLERVDLFPAVSITAQPAGGLSLAECRFICERLAAEVLSSQQSTEYRLVWLREMPAARAPAVAQRP
jgi:multidrug efflux pump subunit AcrB